MRAHVSSLSVIATVSLGCGARTELVFGHAAAIGDASAIGADAAVGTRDVCPSALLTGAPRPIAGECSTRDGRSRVTGPTAPHILWQTAVPPNTDPANAFFIAGLAADASARAYVVAAPNSGADISRLLAFDAVSGAIDWDVVYTPSSQGDGLPVLLTDGALEIVATGASYRASIDRFDAVAGTFTTTAIAAGSDVIDLSPAIGADGAMYVAYTANAGSARARSVVTRLHADTTIAWTSVDLATLGPPPDAGNDVFPSRIALAQNDLVLLVTSIIGTSPIKSLLVALDPSDGVVRWTAPLDGQLLGGPAIAPDGSIALLAGAPPSAKLEVFEATGALRREIDLGRSSAALYAIGLDGT
ncbi:MAG: hypothetical protein ACHREM_25950, partial [Polyangiales bacterium]